MAGDPKEPGDSESGPEPIEGPPPGLKLGRPPGIPAGAAAQSGTEEISLEDLPPGVVLGEVGPPQAPAMSALPYVGRSLGMLRGHQPIVITSVCLAFVVTALPFVASAAFGPLMQMLGVAAAEGSLARVWEQRSRRFYEASRDAAMSSAWMVTWIRLTGSSAQVFIAISTALVLIVGITWGEALGLTFASINVRLGRQGASDAEVEAACKLAHIHEVITDPGRISQGYDTVVDVQAPSGGQKRLIAMARCLLREPEVLLLDEPTENLDADQRVRLSRVIREYARDRTCIVISHDMDFIAGVSDRILVLNGGTCVKQGSHEELLERGGLYRQLYEAQNVDPALVRRQSAVTPG